MKKIVFIVIIFFILAVAATADDVVVLKPKHRTGADLLAAIRAAVGSDGTVNLDERTGSLIVFGSNAAIARAKKVLAQLDVKPRTVRIEVQWINTVALQNLGVKIDWTVTAGRWRVGRLRGGQEMTGDHVETEAGARWRVIRSNAAARQMVRVLEGDWALLLRGTKREFSPSNFGWSGFEGPRIRGRLRYVQTGLLARPRIVGDSVQLDLTPQAELFIAGGNSNVRRYFEAQTTVRVPVGGSILLGVDQSQDSSVVVDTFNGLTVRRESSSEKNALLVEVYVED